MAFARAWIAVLLVWGSRLAAADVRESEYPLAVTDRPIVLPAGATLLDISYELKTYVLHGMRSGFTDDTTPNVAVGHAFGPVEIDLGAGELAYGSVAIDLGGPTLAVNAFFTFPQSKDIYSYTQGISVIHKLVLAPQQFAVFGSASLSLHEIQILDPTPASGHVITARTRAGLEIQLAPNVALISAALVEAPLQQSSAFHSITALTVSAELLFAIRRWDFYVAGSLYDITRTGPSTFLSLGFTKRWGI